MSRLVIGLIWLLHWLPLVLLARVGSGFGRLLYWVVVPRRKVALTNLRLCFPELSEPERRALARRNFALIGRSMLERGLAWWASPERLRATVRIEGLAHLQRLRAEGRPVLLLAPHFLGLDMAGTRLTLEGDFVSVYSPQKDKVFDHWLHHGRSRFNDQLLLSRHDGVRATVKAMKAGRFLPLLAGHGLRPEGIGLRALLRRADGHHHRPGAPGEADRGDGDPAASPAWKPGGKLATSRASASPGRSFPGTATRPTRGA
jgi:lauroyl/myristoyl acyltransferase